VRTKTPAEPIAAIRCIEVIGARAKPSETRLICVRCLRAWQPADAAAAVAHTKLCGKPLAAMTKEN